jgi:glutathione S-transferase
VTSPLNWNDLAPFAEAYSANPIDGPANSQARLRLFGHSESEVRVTLYRDHHAWCPYCQKVWLWLEEKQVPYRVHKVTMFCYGEKESWYLRKVPSGMLPALDLNGRTITESDDILLELERTFGVLAWGMEDPKVLPLRRLERQLFRSWCMWLCYPTKSLREEESRRAQFQSAVDLVESALSATSSPYFLEDFSTVDVVFTPYVERMNASLYYYKGYSLREQNPRLFAWFDAMETRETYRGTQSDFHTHAHDLPPQMGGCWANGELQTSINQARVDRGPWMGLPDAFYPEPETSCSEALYRVLKHRDTLVRLNPSEDRLFDEALRCALTHLVTGKASVPPAGSDVALRYLRDRICVPRDMSIYAARRLRESLEFTAALVGDRQGEPLPVEHRRDQDPANFA